ncbi:AAA domain-containing protein [Henriciella marina]|uniref:AAA domain-containing protein n=1 Tax=Henriciella marina TaxID=453851 RepID=UPI000370FD5B|nr:AAA domain-containing protein [Henriciella marina]
MLPPLPELKPSQIGEFIRFHACERRANLSVSRARIREELPFYGRLENTLDVVLREKGEIAENDWHQSLIESGAQQVLADTETPSLGDVLASFSDKAQDTLAFATEVLVSGRVGAFEVSGRMDFVLLLWRDGRPVIRVVEAKASRKDQTYQRIQAACYLLMTQQVAAHTNINIDGHQLDDRSVEAVVARIDEESRALQNPLELQPLSLSVPSDDLNRLLAAGGVFERSVRADLDTLPYKLEPKCDACVFNVHCFPESARRRKIQLLGLRADLIAALSDHGIHQLDELARLDVDSELAAALSADERIEEDIEVLKARAVARVQTLDLEEPVEGWEVQQLPQRATSLRPNHEINGQRVIRVYLHVDYDYIEDRLLAVAAHVTNSNGRLEVGWRQEDGRYRPATEVEESVGDNRRPLSGIDVVEFKNSNWTHSVQDDAASERTMLENFYRRLIEAIAQTSQADEEYIHFYVWSENEMRRLMEATSRGGPGLLANMSQLFGCRMGREQLIVTPLQTDIHRRFAFGWTGRGLSVATSLRWFGGRYHWTRRVGRDQIDLSNVFQQDIFDFATTLWTEDGEWCEDGVGERQRYELRSRFFDQTSVAYYRALWGAINSEDEHWDAQARSAIQRYERVAQVPGILPTYLTARTHALRWVDERAGFFNNRIEKTPLDIRQLGNFRLRSNSPRQAAIDVLRIDWTMAYMEWLVAQTSTARDRIQSGRCLPLEVIDVGDGDRGSSIVRARIRADLVNTSNDVLQRRYSDGEGDLVRMMSWTGNPQDQARANPAACCWIEHLDWEAGTIQLSTRPARQGLYRQFSAPANAFGEYPYVLLEKSVTSYTHPKTDERLQTNQNNHVDPWFDLSDPNVTPAAPLEQDVRDRLREALTSWRIPNTDFQLLEEQILAVSASLDSRISALQGPPGTGKTATTAVAIVSRIAARLSAGDRVIVTGFTHRAVDTLVERTANWIASLVQILGQYGFELPPVELVRVASRDPQNLPANVQNLDLDDIPRVGDATAYFANKANSVTLLFGTPTHLLKLEKTLGARHSLCAKDLVVDEASMMVFPAMLALASLTSSEASVLVAGDNRQLAPILSHPWDTEDRPPTVRYQPFLSAYEVVARIDETYNQAHPSRISVSRLRHTFRLPPATREVVGVLYLRDDNFALSGRTEHPGPMGAVADAEFAPVWTDPFGLVLVSHSERRSRKENAIERAIVSAVIDASEGCGENSIVVLTPHRAQRALLQQALQDRPEVAIVDTVERLQGGEAATIIVSATASDPDAIASAEQFLMDVHRANVAFSRNEDRLIVIASETLLDHISANIDVYEHSLLWKTLRTACSSCVREIEIDGAVARILTKPQLN